MIWRFFPPESFTPQQNMAFDETIVSIASQTQVPMFRLYDWKPAGISIGVNQSIDEINTKIATQHNISIVRRITGGRAVFHASTDFTYAIAAPVTMFQDTSVTGIYRFFCTKLCNAFHSLSPEIKNNNDILIKNKKISGNAAKITNGIYLQHGTIINELDSALHSSLFNLSPELLRNKVTSLQEHLSVSRESFYKTLQHCLLDGFKWNQSALTEEEQQTFKLLIQKYSSEEWTNQNGIEKGACYTQF